MYMYRLAVLPSPSQQFFIKYQKIVRNFIWNQGTSKIKTEILYGLKLQGGLALVNLRKRDCAIKMQWVEKIKSDTGLNTRVQTILSDPLGSKIWSVNLVPKDLPYLSQILNKGSFWMSVFESWVREKSDFPVGKNEVLNQLLWFNSYVRINNTPIWYPL